MLFCSIIHFDQVCKIHDLFWSNDSFKFCARAMAELRVLRLFGKPLEFLPKILPLHKPRHLSLANIMIVADDILRSVNVHIEVVLHASNIFSFKFLIQI